MQRSPQNGEIAAGELQPETEPNEDVEGWQPRRLGRVPGIAPQNIASGRFAAHHLKLLGFLLIRSISSEAFCSCGGAENVTLISKL